MKQFLKIFTIILNLNLIFADLMEMNCKEITALGYYDILYGTKCTIENIASDSSTRFVIRTSNSQEYNKQIQEVEFQNSDLYDIPSELFITFAHLAKLTVNKCGIIDIHKNNFLYATNLIELRMRFNKLTKLPNSVFSSAIALETLDLSSNQINEIEPEAFVKLTNLQYLVLSDNKLVSLDENLFRQLHNLRSIRLDSNKLQVIEEKLFENAMNLTEIRLDANEIAIIKGDAFGMLQRLKFLYLGSNRLLSVNIKNSNVERLWIPYNKITHLELNQKLKLLYAPYNHLSTISFNGNTDLTEIKLRQNFINDIFNFSSLNRLEILDISYNPLNSLNISSFARMSELVKLNLEFTNITTDSLTYGTFSHNLNLTQIDLSYNQLGRINFEVFPQLNLLTHLKVDGNNLTEIPYENLKVHFPKLLLIGITDNDWNCTYLSTMVKKLKSLNLIIFVFGNQRVYDDTNFDGIRCVMNNTKNFGWVNPVEHLDDNDITTKNPNDIDKNLNFEDVRGNLSKVWNKISEIEIFVNQIESNVKEVEFIKSQPLISEGSQNVQSDVGIIKIILCFMCSVMVGYALISILKFARNQFVKQKFFYPSESFRRSTATIQTAMEHVM